MIQRAYCTALGLQTHYRTAGEGKPLVLLHPSPLSSAFMVPMIESLQGQATVWALDTPGYGNTDPLAEEPENLDPYVEWLAAFVREQGVSSTGIYGSATGAQIAIQFARRYPDMTDYLVLDNAVHFTEQEKQDIMARYFPDMSPQADGSHLQLAWEMSAGLYRYFPWFDQREESRISSVEPPAALVHATALAYLNSSVEYPRAYRAAFRNEDARNMQQITVPTAVIRWAGSILKRYADRLDGFEWPENIEMVHCDSSSAARMEAIRSAVEEFTRIS